MNPGNFEVREIAGSPCQIGLRYGQSIKSGFSRIVARYAENYLKNHDSARVEVISEGMEGYLRDHAPTLIEEMAGIAEGSGVSFADVFKHNLCSCIGTTLSSEASVREAAHCTSIGFPNSNRGSLLGKNTDCGDHESSLIRFVPMLCWRPSTGLASLGLTHMRTVWRHVGVNEKGLALGGSSVMGMSSLQFLVSESRSPTLRRRHGLPNRRLLLWIRARPILPGFRFRIHSHNKLLLLFFPLQVL